MKLSLLLFAAVAIGCGTREPTADRGPAPDTTAQTGVGQDPGPASPWFVGRVWVRADQPDLPGVMRVFLADGTLVMDSCWETYRLASWQPVSDTVVAWQEDAARIEALVAADGEEGMRLWVVAGSDTLEERYRQAAVPYVCPDMPR